jgi:6-pyruvoyl-tetrahydropterin synthase
MPPILTRPSFAQLTMYKITTGIHIHFAHHIRGHAGPCVSIHGHTWMFEVTLAASELDAQGFVVDFDELYERVLTPCHRLLDHSLALGETSYVENRQVLAQLGTALVETRRETLGNLGSPQSALDDTLGGARNERPGGIKLAVFPFSPTSERLARWLHEVADACLGDDRVRVTGARIFETLLPTEAVAEYSPG